MEVQCSISFDFKDATSCDNDLRLQVTTDPQKHDCMLEAEGELQAEGEFELS